MDSLLGRMVREHPTLLLTLCYFLITLIGVIYSYYFYQEFDINILKFADLSDFLLASILEPVSLLVFLVACVIMLLIYGAEFWLRKNYAGYGQWTAKKMPTKFTGPLLFIFVVSILVVSFVQTLAVYNADGVKSGEIDEFTVRISDAGDRPQERTLALLGNSSRFSYLYDVESKEVLVIPLENIALLSKQLPTLDNPQAITDSPQPITEN